MKSIILLSLSLFACQNYTAAQVGPDRFSVSSRNRDASDYTRLLQRAYNECKMSGYKDYSIPNTVVDGSGLTFIVQCRQEPQKYEAANVPNQVQPQAPANETSSLSKAFQSAVDSIKRSFQQ